MSFKIRDSRITKNREGDLVVVDIATFSRRESMLRLREQLVAAEEDRLLGYKGFSIDEIDEMMKLCILTT